MKRYGWVSERSQSDPSPEERMWQLGLGVGAELYPERPEEADCIHYLRTGSCGYGSRCRFNHPRDHPSVGAVGAGGGEYPQREGHPVCQYYMRTGTCKFGASCKYHHPRHGAGSVSNELLNYYDGYPFRPGEKECSYYMKTGQCKFGATCKFHHPQPAGVHALTQSPAPQVAAVSVPMPVPASTLYPTVQSPSVPSAQQYGVVVARPPLWHGSYVQGPYGPVLVSPGMVPLQGWSPYAASVNPMTSPGAGTQSTVGSSSIYGITQFSASGPAYTGTYQPAPSSVSTASTSQKEHPFPERPGQPECQYYMKTGDCKFGSSCRYHHPRELIEVKTDVALSPVGLPLRPDESHCTHYTQRGVCKFGPACKFDHPMGILSYSPSASSLADMPVAPYPVGSSMGTLAPSSSSSDLRPELISGSRNDSVSTQMSSSVGTSSGTLGSIISKSGPVPHSSMQQSGLSSDPSTADGSKSSSAEASNSS